MAKVTKEQHPIIKEFVLKLQWWPILDQLDGKINHEELVVFKIQRELKEIHAAEKQELSDRYIQAIPIFNKFLQKKCDVSLQFLFLINWLDLCIKLVKYPDGDFVKKHLDKLLNNNIPPELKGICYGQMGIYYRQKGNATEGNRHLQLCLKQLEPENPRFIPFLVNYGNITSYFGTYPTIKKELKRYLKTADRSYWSGDDLLLFFYSIEMGHVQAAWKALRRLPENSKLPIFQYHKSKIATYAALLCVIACEWNIAEISHKEKQQLQEHVELKYSKPYVDYRDIIQTLKEIYKGDYDNAISKSKSRIDKSNILWECSWFYCIYIRADLSTGRVNTAELALKGLMANGYDYIWNDWLLTRIELAKNNLNNARYYFNKLLKAVEKHKAHDRFDFEVKISNEIRTTDIVQLMNHKNIKTVKPPLLKKESPVHQIPDVIGISNKVLRLKESISKAAPHDINVLILGETGTGKEVAAKSLHNLSPRKSEPYLAINCAAISETLLASELFGHQKGAFTGATEYHQGIFEQAGKGTVFLDEIGEVTPGIQSALLRVLETKDIKPIGSSKSKKINCRIIAATNANLEQKVADNEFRMDLLHRLKRFVVHTSPLREKQEDIALLSHYFLNQNKGFSVEASLTSSALEALRKYDWPGNARELKNEMDNLRIFDADRTVFDLEHLDSKFQQSSKVEVQETPMPLANSPIIEENTDQADIEKTQLCLASEVVFKNKIAFRRIDRIKKLFQQHPILTRAEIIKIIGFSHLTATKDLKRLIDEKFIKKVMPSKSPRSHYFEKL